MEVKNINGYDLKDEVARTQLETLTTIRKGIVVVGDSLAKGDDPSLNFASISSWLTQMTGEKVVNNGVWGYTLGQVISGLQSNVIALNPKYCVVLVGTNDINNGEQVNSMILQANTIIETLLNNNIIPIMLSIPPRNDVPTHNTKIREYNTKLQASCLQHYNVNFVDIYSVLCMPDNNGGAKAHILRSTDGLHFTSYGAYTVAKAIIESGYIKECTNFNENAQCRLWNHNAFDNFEISIFTQDGEDLKADQFTFTNTAGGTFTKELRNDVPNTMGYEYNYQVMTKPVTSEYKMMGMSTRLGPIHPGAKVRFMVDYELITNDDTNLADSYFGVEVNITNNADQISYNRFLESYELYESKGTFYCDIDLPVDYKIAEFTCFLYGLAGQTLKLGNFRAYRIG